MINYLDRVYTLIRESNVYQYLQFPCINYLYYYSSWRGWECCAGFNKLSAGERENQVRKGGGVYLAELVWGRSIRVVIASVIRIENLPESIILGDQIILGG